MLKSPLIYSMDLDCWKKSSSKAKTKSGKDLHHKCFGRLLMVVLGLLVSLKPVHASVWLYQFGHGDPGQCDTIGSHFVKRRDTVDWVGIGGTTFSRTIHLGTSVAQCLDRAVPFVTKLTGSTTVAWTKTYSHAVIKTSSNDWGRFTDVTAVTLMQRYVTTDSFLLAVLKYQDSTGAFPDAGSMMLFLDWGNGNTVKSYHLPMAAP